MIPIPTSRLLGLLAAWTALGLGASCSARLVPLWAGAAWLLGGLLLAEALLVFWPKPLTGLREVNPSLALGVWKAVRVRIESSSRLSWRITLRDGHPEGFELRHPERRGKVPARGFLELGYRVRPTSRGFHRFTPAQVRVEGPLGLLQRECLLAGTTDVKVFPDFAAVARYALLAIDNRLSALGILRRPRRGEGMEFHQLREYRTGDSLRRIDWKASARSRRLVSREYQDERDQQVFFLLDCGRRMRALDPGPEGQIGHFDQALNAMFLLSFVALKQGDAVGVTTCAAEHPRQLAPRKGLKAMDTLFRVMFDLQPSTQATDYLAAAQALRSRLRKRSLVVLLTNLRDEEEDSLLPALRLLSHTHLVLVANLREAAVDHVLSHPPQAFSEALTQAAALDWLSRREASLRSLANQGVQVLDVRPAALPTALVNRYLELKTSGIF